MYLPAYCQLSVVLHKCWLTAQQDSNFKPHITADVLFLCLGNQLCLLCQWDMCGDNSNLESVAWMLLPETSEHFLSTLFHCVGCYG